MKSIKEKAEAYDKVLEWATEAHKVCDGMLKEDLEHLFPELKESEESEDERIRKELIEQVVYIVPNNDEVDSEGNVLPTYQKRIDKYLAWLEKQGEQKPAEKYNIDGIDSKNAQGKLGEMIKNLKPADKVEPFNKYEGLTDFERTLADICIGWIGEELGWKQYIKDNADVLLKIVIKKFNSVQDTPFEQNPAWSEDDERIYQSIMDDTIQENQLNGKQIDWLRDIKYRYFPQSRQEWSKEDEKIYNRICDIVHAAAFANYDVDENGKECGEYAKIIGWLESLKDRVGCEVNCTTTKEWSKEDEYVYNEILKRVADKKLYEHDLEYIYKWLKSLRPQSTWRPSDEQMRVLDLAIRCGINRGTTEATTLISLFNDLKKLRGE